MATTPEFQKSTAKKANSPKMVALGSFIGTTIEWYDFFLYGTAAALVFSPLFFPNVSPAVGLIAAFGTYAVGFVARPIGGLVAGHLGDKIGRKAMLVASLLIMGSATALIGVLPTYASIGIWAPILLMVLRIAQGFGVGGEWGGAALLSVESAPSHRRGFYGSFTQIGVSAGMLLATGLFAAGRYTLSEEAFLAWGWRIPFLLSAVLVMVGLIIRLKLSESDSFEKNKANNAIPDKPLVEVLQKERRAVFLTIGMRLSQNAIYYLYTVFALAYIARSFGPSSNVGLNSVLIASAIGLISVPIWAHISDLIGRKRIYLFGAITTAIFIVPFFMLADTGNAFALTMAMVIGLNFFHDAMYGPQAAFFSEMFSTGVRYSGASMGYQIGSVLSGGFAPLIATSLLALGNGKPWLVIAYFGVLSIITIVCAALAPETNKKDISGVPANPTDAPKSQLPAKTAH